MHGITIAVRSFFFEARVFVDLDASFFWRPRSRARGFLFPVEVPFVKDVLEAQTFSSLPPSPYPLGLSSGLASFRSVRLLTD